MARGRPSKKQHILATAQQLFSTLGYQGTSIDLVVKEAGVSKPTVYNNFPTKQALLHNLLEQALDEALQQRQQLLESSGLAFEQGLVAAFGHIAQTPLHLAIYRICYGESYKLDATSAALFARYEATLRDWCRDWLAQHEYTPDEASLLACMGICREGIVIPALSGAQAIAAPVLAQALSKLL